MPFAGDGTFTRTPGTLISNQGALVSAQVNNETNNAIDGINGKVNLNGLLPMTGLQLLYGDGTAALHGATVQQAQKQIISHSTAVAGTVDAIQVTMSPASTTWTLNEIVRWRSAGANTVTAPTISKDGGATSKTIKKGASAALAIGDLGAAGTENTGLYNGTDVILISAAAGSSISTASTTEVLTGTDTAKAVTPDALAALWEAGSNITDGATITIGEGGYFNLITSTTAITAFTVTTDKAGRTFRVRFDTARTLTHNATSLIIPGGDNITTAQGDIAQIRSLGSGNVIVEWYQKTSGLPIVDRSPTVIKKAADQSVASTTLANDSDFTFSLAANTKYIGELVLDITHTGSENFKFDVTGPASPTSVTINAFMLESSSGIGTNSSAGEPVAAFSTTITISPGTSAVVGNSVLIKFFINNGANAGTFQFRWANGTTATSKMVKARSWMSYQVVN